MSQQMAEGRAGTSAPATAPEFDLVRVVDRSPLRTAPFDHIQMENVFPSDFYRQMLDGLPAREKYHQLYHRDALRHDGSSTRLRLYLYRENLWRLPQPQRRLWGGISAALTSPALELAFKRKFRAALEDRFQMPAENVPLYPIPILVRDQPGYRIGIHADALTKAITVQLYLPTDSSQAHLGTIFHTTRAQDGTDQPVAMRFLPSTGYAFAVRRKESWHSAPTTTEADGERRSVMLTYYVDDEANRMKRRTQRLGIFFGRYPRV
ncbi:MAG TPA: hypothetical protein VHA35_12900 [Dongiaceae bacterium]|jgi:hypothetical protein|nr:hypothetical protein [Dongiaceae bacterium]